MEIVKFYIVERLVQYVILGFDLCDKLVEHIRPRRRFSKVHIGTLVLIIRGAITRSKTQVQIPEEQVYSKPTKMSKARIFIRKRTRLEPESQTWGQTKRPRPESSRSNRYKYFKADKYG